MKWERRKETGGSAWMEIRSPVSRPAWMGMRGRREPDGLQTHRPPSFRRRWIKNAKRARLGHDRTTPNNSLRYCCDEKVLWPA
jgi:hypothetical protein